MNVTHIKPSTIALLTTLRCTAACNNCCFGCTPKQGQDIEGIEVPDYPQLGEILKDLSYPPLWESMQEKDTDVSFMEIIREMGFYSKYHLSESGKRVFCDEGQGKRLQ